MAGGWVWAHRMAVGWGGAAGRIGALQTRAKADGRAARKVGGRKPEVMWRQARPHRWQGHAPGREAGGEVFFFWGGGGGSND